MHMCSGNIQYMGQEVVIAILISVSLQIFNFLRSLPKK